MKMYIDYRDYIILRSNAGRCASYNLDITSSDPYDHVRVRRFDQILRRTLSKIFRERRFTSSQIRKLIRAPRKHTNNNPIIKLILEKEPALGKLLLKRSKLSLLWITVLSCYQESAELLVRFGADLSELYGLESSYQLTKSSTLLHALLQMYPSSWNERFIDLIMDHGVDLNARDTLDRTVLHVAAKNGRVKAAKMLLEKGADVNVVTCCGMTPLLDAASTSEVDKLLPLLIKYGADITAKDQSGCNVLYHLALSPNWKNVELARVLIEKGISPCEVGLGQNQPIHEAVLMENIELVNLFLDHGANVNARGFDDEFPLCIAMECEDPAMLLTLLKRGADVDLKEGRFGETVLHRLLGMSDESAIKKLKILLSLNADMFSEARNGLSFFNVICELNDMEHPSTGLMLKTLAVTEVCWQERTNQLKDEEMIEEEYPELRKLYQDCFEEACRLRDTYFIESCSFFDLLTKCQCEIAPLMRNLEFKSKFRLYDLSIFSPIFAEDILEAFEHAEQFHRSVLEHEDLLDEAFDYIFPFIIARKVTRYALKCETCELKRIVRASRSYK